MNIIVMSTPRTGSTYLTNYLSYHYRFENLGEAIRRIYDDSLNKNKNQTDIIELWKKGNNVLKINGTITDPEYIKFMYYLLEKANKVIYLKRTNIRAQVLSLYAALVTGNFTPFRKGEAIKVNPKILIDAITQVKINSAWLDRLSNEWPGELLFTEELNMYTNNWDWQDNIYTENSFILSEECERILIEHNL